jgi:hypothetical protein
VAFRSVCVMVWKKKKHILSIDCPGGSVSFSSPSSDEDLRLLISEGEARSRRRRRKSLDNFGGFGAS